MIIYDRTLSDNVVEHVDRARRNIKGKLRFQNCDRGDETVPIAPAIQNLPADLLRQLVQLLENTPSGGTVSPRAPYAQIMYGHDPNFGKGDPDKPGPWACTQGTSIWLFDRWLNEKDPERQAAVLAHELVHVLCGNELDSEMAENIMFQQGSTIDPSDVYSIRSKRWRGRWFRVVRPFERTAEIPIDVRYGWRDSIGRGAIETLLRKLRQRIATATPMVQVENALNDLLADVPVEV